MPRDLLSTLLLLSFAACSRAPDSQTDLERLDRELANSQSPENTRDPAVAQAIAAPIMADPTLSQASNGNAVRPPPRPDSGAVPLDPPHPDPVNAHTLRHAPAARQPCPQCDAHAESYTLGALAASQGQRGCASVSYSAAWANRLPADLPLYPGAQVVEAAGNASGRCALRMVTFASGAAPAKMIDWYYTRATTAGYSVEHRTGHGTQVLVGTKGSAAYVVYVTPRQDGGSDVDLLTNAGT
ncbi:hypothetical protein [Sphingomonas sp.]|uniref:hypothetical protein n=1 Tax=Sphingomonas sp. TaxID=28214 RepID=UPI003CC6CA7D